MVFAEKEVTKPNWGDEVADEEENEFQTTVTFNEKGEKIVVRYSDNEKEQTIKTTQIYRVKKVTTTVNKRVAERKKLAKFGAAANHKPGPDPSTTNVSEEVLLKLQSNMKNTEFEDLDQQNLKKPQDKKIVCRYCSLNHWSISCPYKDSVAPAESQDTAESKDVKDSSAPGKYVPPSLRGGRPAESSSGNRRDEFPTVRVSNLSEDVQDSDLADLMAPFGRIMRLFLARDRDTGLCKGFAYVSYSTQQEAEKAAAKIDGHGYDNLILRAEVTNRDNK